MAKARSGRGPAAKSVDEYLAALPEDARSALEKLRKTIKAAAPDATEQISYQIPAYKHHGMLVSFAAFKNHLSFYVMSPATMRAHAAELERYPTSAGGIRFTPDKPLPARLVTKLVKARIAENEKKRRGDVGRAARSSRCSIGASTSARPGPPDLSGVLLGVVSLVR